MAKTSILPPKLFLQFFAGLCVIVHAVHPQAAEKPMSPCELETLLQEILNPNSGYEMHASSLRSQLRDLIESQNDNIDNANDFAIEEDKRSIQSLTRDGYILNGKRNIGALARAGLLRTPYPDEIKRSIATLAKNGQLPSREPDADGVSRWMDEKRNVATLARAGLLNGKRNLASIVRSGYPSYVPKRSISSIARANSLGKRNIATMARDWALPNHQTKMSADYQTEKDAEKRNIGSLKNAQRNGRKKREIPYSEFELNENADGPEVSAAEYEELVEALNSEYPLNTYPVEEKRFLGSVARGGWSHYRPSPMMIKRHVGSLARLGLLHSSDSSAYRQQRSRRENDEELMDKRHIGALARPDITTHQTVAFNPSSQAFVDDATPQYQTQLAGVLRDYNHIGVDRPVSPHYTNEAFENRLIPKYAPKSKNYLHNLLSYNDISNGHSLQSECLKRVREIISDNYFNTAADYGNDDDDEDDNNFNSETGSEYNPINPFEEPLFN